jgi:hypothetical protein
MKSLDKNLAAAFKAAAKEQLDIRSAEATSKELYEIRQHALDNDLLILVEQLIALISSPSSEKPISGTIDLLHNLLEIGYTSTAKELFLSQIASLEHLSLCEILSVAPNVSCFEKWGKSTKKTTQEIQDKLLSDPLKTYQTIGADWLFSYASPKTLGPIHELLLSQQIRPKYLLQWNEFLLTTIKKDKNGEFLESLILVAENSAKNMMALVEFIRTRHSVFKSVAETLALILTRKVHARAAAYFVRELFAPAFVCDSSQTEIASVLLARLGTTIVLTDCRSPEAKEVLEFVRKTARQLRSIIKGESNQSRIWILDNLLTEEHSSDSKLCINLQGARYIALAFEKIDQGFPPKDILSVTARHLGLTTIGKRDEVVPYDPLKHDDTEGGLVPDDLVLILETGLAFNNDAVLRAKVIKRK